VEEEYIQEFFFIISVFRSLCVIVRCPVEGGFQAIFGDV
jgi:hypothetical protein